MALHHIRATEIEAELPPGHWSMSARTLAEWDERLRVQSCEMAADGGAEAHVHDAQDQMFVVTSGALRVRGEGDDELRVDAGDAVLIPARVPHATVADGVPTTYLVLTFPPAPSGELGIAS